MRVLALDVCMKVRADALRGHKRLMRLFWHIGVVVRAAVAELDAELMRSLVITDGFDVRGVDGLHEHGDFDSMSRNIITAAVSDW